MGGRHVKITIVAATGDHSTIDGRRLRRTAALLSQNHEVRILSALEGAEPLEKVEQVALMSSDGLTPRRSTDVSESVLRSRAASPAAGLSPGLGLSALAEGELILAVEELESDVVITEARLSALVRSGLSPAVRLIALAGERDVETLELLAHADLVATHDTALEAIFDFGPLTPGVHVIEPWSAQDPAFIDATDGVVAAWGGAADLPRLERLTRAFLAMADRHPGRTLHIGLEGNGAGSLRRLADDEGLHGVLVVSQNARFHSQTLPAADAIIVCTQSTDDGLSVALDALDAGRPVMVDRDVVNAVSPLDRIVSLIDGSSYSEGLETLLKTEMVRHPEVSGLLEERLRAAKASWASLLSEATKPIDAHEHLRLIADRRLSSCGLRTITATDVPVHAIAAEQAERNILSHDGSLVRWAGTLNVESDSVLEPEMFAENLRSVADALTAAGLEFIVLTGPHEPGRIALAASQRQATAAALRRYCESEPLYVEVLTKRGTVRHQSLAAAVAFESHDPAARLFRPVVSSTRTLRYAASQSCTIEFWEPASDKTDFFEAPLSPSQRGELLSTLSPDDTLRMGEIEYPTTREITATAIDDVTFPIDAVWTWVDGADPEWQKRRADWQGTSPTTFDGDDPNRFIDAEELRYSLRSVAMYAPWIRHLYIVTDRQRPAWLADHDRVTVVDHSEIFGEGSALPTFNSHAIENNLHHIEGLSEHFLYFNDDVFLGRRVTAEDFFTPGGLSKAFVSPTTIPPGPPDALDNGYFAARKNNRDLIEEAAGRILVHGYLHTPHALQKKLLTQVEKTFSSDWQRTSATRFRSPADIAVLSSLHHDLGKLQGLVVDGKLRSKYIRAGRRDAAALMRTALARRHLDVFCLNSTATEEIDPGLKVRSMKAFMSAYFPMTAPWEQSP